MPALSDKVALVTGAGRGMGGDRSALPSRGPCRRPCRRRGGMRRRRGRVRRDHPYRRLAHRSSPTDAME